MNRTPVSRRGSALLMVMAIVIALAALTVTLSTNTVARLQAERSRDDQVELLAASESAANEAVAWMQSPAGTAVIKGLPAVPQVITNDPTPEKQYNTAVALATTSKATSATYTTMLPQLQYKDSSGTIYGTITGCAANMRNGCAVDCTIVCLNQTAAGKVFPDGTERYLIFSSATKGDKVSDAARFQRRRVMTVVSPLPTQVWKQSMYAISSYDVGGSAGADSWNGTSKYDYGNPSPDATGNGTVKSGGTVTTSGSAKVDGKTSNVKLPLPTLTYDPSGAVSIGSLNSARTLTGPGSFRASEVTASGDITISGSGDVTLYVDGPFNVDSIRYTAGSTANLIIKQANYSTSLGTTSFDLGGLVGDIAQVGGGAHADYSSQNVSTTGPVPSRLQFYSGYTGDMTFNGNGAMAGIIYAPGANIKMNGTFQMFGAMIADGFDGKVNGTFNFHFDDRLGSLTLPIDPQFSASGWNIYNVAVNQN